MNCNHTQKNLDEYLDDTLNAEQSGAIELHVNSCGDCSAALEQLRAMRATLRHMPVEPARPGFAADALRVAREAHLAKSNGAVQDNSKPMQGFRHWFTAGFGGALAAGVALWAVFSLLFPVQPIADLPTFNIALNQTRNVSLAINVPDEIDGVTLSVDLPQNFALVGHPGKRTLAWKTRLKKGRNVLTLPVMALEPGEGQLVARVMRDNKSRVLRINLQTIAEGQSSRGFDLSGPTNKLI
ncbi:MAG: anti-sigma factor [Acidiferrobacterales bacterium]